MFDLLDLITRACGKSCDVAQHDAAQNDAAQNDAAQHDAAQNSPGGQAGSVARHCL
jgi:hypothetical protein